jgi:hypothetical protein
MWQRWTRSKKKQWGPYLVNRGEEEVLDAYSILRAAQTAPATITSESPVAIGPVLRRTDLLCNEWSFGIGQSWLAAVRL